MPFSLLVSAGTNNRNSKTNSNDDFKAATEKQTSEKQTLISIFEINIIRYALGLGDVKPEDIDPFFMIDFMSLPENYFLGDAPQKYG